MYLIGLDIGTTACKAHLFDKTGRLLAFASREVEIKRPHQGWAEQNPDLVWNLAQEVMRSVVLSSGIDEVAAIGLSVQGEAVTAVDQQGRTLRPMILGMDTRTATQNTQLANHFTARALFDMTGMPVHTVNTLPKLLWIKQNEPEIWQQAHKFLLYEDFLIMRMTGRPAISRCLASRTQLYDLHRRMWSEEILSFLELDMSQLAEVLDSGTAVALMREEVSAGIGFAHPPLVVTGGHDQACGALGVGLVEPGLAMVSTGTAEVVELALPAPLLNETLYEGNISVYEHTVPGLYLAMTLNHSGGLLLRWFRDEFCKEEVRAVAVDNGDAYARILAGAPDEPTGLLVLPHFAGSGSPTFDIASKGAILGLSFEDGKSDIAKALLEGLTYELRINLDLLRAGGAEINELRAIGGGARSPLWLQMKADITGIPVVVPAVTDAACWGAALLAGYGAAIFADLTVASRINAHLPNLYEPSVNRARYDDLYEIYKDLYPAVVSLSNRLAALSG